MADNRPIGVFDSGVGGLTVVKEIIKQLPGEDIIYFGDTKRVPYGTKSKETIIKFAKEAEAFLLSKNVKMIIAACGTVSAVASDTKNELPVPFLGVVKNASKAATIVSKNKKIGVIGTVATIKSNAHKKEILNIMPEAEVYTQSCSLFVPLVEAGMTDENDSAVLKISHNYLDILKEKEIDTLILGCTHYPLLKDVIKKIMGEGVTLINMGESTALEAVNVLNDNSLIKVSDKKGVCDIYASDITDAFLETAELILGDIDKKRVYEVDIEGFK